MRPVTAPKKKRASSSSRKSKSKSAKSKSASSAKSKTAARTNALRRQLKSVETRYKIVDAAMKLLRERGYEQTTMALIAEEAGVSKGNAYYYFESKDTLVQYFYDELQAKHRAVVDERLPHAHGFIERLRVVLLSWHEVAQPYHAFGDKLFKNAADPSSALSPFSPESKRARDAAMAVFREVVAGSALELDDETRDALVTGLWFAHMGLVLFWVFDKSADQTKTRAVIERVLPLVSVAVDLLQSPLSEEFRPQIVGMIRDIASGLAIAS